MENKLDKLTSVSGPVPAVLVMLVALLTCSTDVAHAQETKGTNITGRTLTIEGEAVIGATVKEQGRNNQTMTDKEGFFTLTVQSDNAGLEVQFVGMKTKVVPLGKQTYVEIILEEETIELDELVIIGYGAVRKSDLTGAVASVSADVFNERMVTSVEDALRGQVPGVSVTSSDGQPGQALNIRIRGTGSINASNSPLYVIDDVIAETADISPRDIAHMEILKDASATAIYGSRGANGVIIITTKKGNKGKTRLEINSQLAMQQPVRLLEMMNAYDYAEMRYRQTLGSQYWKRSGVTPTFAAGKDYYVDSENNYYGFDKSNAWSDYAKHLDESRYSDSVDRIYNTDWQRALLQNALTQDYSMVVRGADEKTSYAIMGNVFNQEGVVLNSGARRLSLRTNVNRTLANWAKFSYNLNGSRFYQEGLASNETMGVTMNMLSQPPTKPLSEDEWEAVPGEDSNVNNNPFFQVKNIDKDIYRDNLTMRMAFDLDIWKDVKFRVAGDVRYSSQTNQNFYPKATNQGRNFNGRAQYQTFQTLRWNQENLILYTPKAWGIHRFDLMGGMTMEESTMKRVNTEVHDITVESLKANALQEGTVAVVPTTPFTKITMTSFLARSNYSLKNRYLFTATLRADASSRFGVDNKWALFPSAAFAWKANEEELLKDVDFLSNLKFRLSYGVSGNTAIPPYQSLDVMATSFYPMYGEEPVYGVRTLNPENPHLKWEKSTQYNVGADVGLFNDRLTLGVEAYLKQTRDLLFEVSTPGHTGYISRWSNIGAVDNKGLEIAVNGAPLNTGKTSLDIGVNVAFNRSRIVNLGEADWLVLNPDIHPTLTDFGYMQVNNRIGNWFGYRTNGVWRKQSEIDGLPDGYTQLGVTKDALFPGHTKFIDGNNDGVIDDNDRVILGNAEPQFTGGFYTTFRYNQLTLNVGLEFAYGFDIFNATAKYLEELRGSNNQLARAANYWRPALYDITTGALVDPGNENANLRRPNSPVEMRALDRHIEDGSYLRVSDVTLSYSLPQRLRAKMHLHKLSLFCSVKNAFVFTNYSGYDPDVSIARGTYTDLLPHLDYGAYPRFRGYIVGMNFIF